MRDTELADLQSHLGYIFKNPSLLTTALTHRSYLNEFKDITESNERMEFLGDAVLEVIASDFLYHYFPNEPEGKLTAIRSKIVQTRTLAAVAQRLHLGDYLLLSKGEAASGGANNASLLADLVEAVIGSIYLDGSMQAAKSFVHEQILKDYKVLISQAEVEDWKSHLQEVVQAKGGLAPTYEVVKEEGPDHDRIFTVAVHYFDKPQATGTGKSKQAAQQAAAREALQQLTGSDGTV